MRPHGAAGSRPAQRTEIDARMLFALFPARQQPLLWLSACCFVIVPRRWHLVSAQIPSPRLPPPHRHFVQASVEDEKGQIQLFLNSVPLLSSLRPDEKMLLVDAFQEEAFVGEWHASLKWRG